MHRPPSVDCSLHRSQPNLVTASIGEGEHKLLNLWPPPQWGPREGQKIMKIHAKFKNLLLFWGTSRNQMLCIVVMTSRWSLKVIHVMTPGLLRGWGQREGKILIITKFSSSFESLLLYNKASRKWMLCMVVITSRWSVKVLAPLVRGWMRLQGGRNLDDYLIVYCETQSSSHVVRTFSLMDC